MYQDELTKNQTIIVNSKNAYITNVSNVKLDSNGFPTF